MDNEQLLNERWKDIDKKLKKYLNDYKKLNQKTQDKIQDIFNSIDFSYTDINKTIPKSKKNRLDRYIRELQEQGLLTDYFGYEARAILNKKNVSYAEMLSIMIEGAYIEENKSLLEYTDNLLYNVCEISYNQGLEDIKKAQPKVKELVPFKVPIWYTLMNIPILDATYRTYLLSLAISNADELYKKTLANIQLQKKLDVDSAYYKDLFQKQRNRLISNSLKSGTLVNIAETMANEGYLEAGLQNDVEKCLFIAEIDEKTTKMCNSLDGQVFYLNKMNTYQRYSDLDNRIVTYHTKGLVVGENLPPINNHFHWCRSVITYLLNKSFKKQYEDITYKWLKQDKSNEHYKPQLLKKTFNYKGKQYNIDNHNVKYEFKKGEKEFANWLSQNSNKKIILLPKINYPENIKTPDYRIDDEYFDFKYTTGSSSQLIYHNLYNAKKQAENFIVEITNKKININDIYLQIENVYRKLEWVQKIGIKYDNKFIIFKRK